MKGGFGCSPCCSQPCDSAGFYSLIIDDSDWLAQSFITPSGGLSVTSITLILGKVFGGIPEQASSKVQVRIYSDNGGATPSTSAPGTLLKTLTATGNVTSGEANVVFSSSATSLSGSTKYWMVTVGLDRFTPINCRVELFFGAGCAKSTPLLSYDSGSTWDLSEDTQSQLVYYVN